MHLAILSDRELVRHADLAFDPLTSTDLERELVRRLEANHGARDEIDQTNSAWSDVTEACESAGLERDQLPKLLLVLSEHDIANADDLREALERDRDFQEVAEELAEPFARLAALINPTPTTAPKEQDACTPAPSH